VSAPLAVLREVFGYPEFRGVQQQIVEHVSAGADALVLMPTGAGKSLCYQIPAILRQRAGHGVTLVVSPLIALMHDQVSALDELGVPAAFLNSSLELNEARRVEQDLLAGRITLLYAAPERVLTERFATLLGALHERGKLALFAIDEAHCVSQWGHDFRAEYLGLGSLHERFPEVPRIALTATADEHTRADILDRLQLQDARRFITSFDRPNIRYQIVEKSEPRRQLLQFIQTEHAGAAGIVYCQSRKKVEETAEFLSEEGVPALPYHAGFPAEQRRVNQDRFLREDGLVMVATIAFGMGIDKPDVRFVAHLDLPRNIEGYYQETGRGGRDGQPADAWMTYGLADVVNQRRMIDESEAEEDFKRLQRAKLDALLALAEAHDCRRVRLLAYFGESGAPCGNCDNCLNPPVTWNATEAARKLLSCIYRFHQQRGQRFGSGHLIDVLRGKETDKVAQYQHQHLSNFGIGADLSEGQWRGVLRQLIALGHVQAQGEFNTLALTESAREVLRGEIQILMREPPAARSRARAAKGRPSLEAPPPVGPVATRLAKLKAWRAETARARNVPAYVVFHDATLEDMARVAPGTYLALGAIGGVGARKLEAYGEEILQLLAAED